MTTLLQVDNLKTHFHTLEGVVKAVDGISFSLANGEALGIAGETGSGKSVLMRSIMRNLPGYAKSTADNLTLEDIDLFSLSETQMQAIWGKDISIIFQNPASFINPLFTIEQQMVDVIRTHEKVNQQKAYETAREMLVLVGMPDPDAVLKSYPFQLSGGMIQRVMIALSLSCNPKLMIADEPTTALDVTIQAQILNLLKEVKNRAGGLILITHNLAIIHEVCDAVIIMYAGKIMEWGSVQQVMKTPLHPYTKALLAAIPKMKSTEKKLKFISGNIPSMVNPPTGCRFSPRCELAMSICSSKEPEMHPKPNGHKVACHAVFSEGSAI